MTLTEFLLARIGEDEADRWELHNGFAKVGDADLYGCNSVACPGEGSEVGASISLECDCRYPVRVLAECEAKRRIIECGLRTDALKAQWEGPLDPKYVGYDAAIKDALRALGTVYASHPDYLPEWRP